MSRNQSALASILAGTAALSVMVAFVAIAGLGQPKPEASSEPLRPEPRSPPKPDDLVALARCLRSEDEDPAVQVAIGWICIQVAKRRGQSVWALLTGGHGYGPQKIFVEGKAVIRFASTDKPATDTTMLLAAALLSGAIEPPRSFQKAAPTSFVERSKASRRVGADGRPLQPETTLTRIVDLQSDFGGLVGRIGRWYFYRNRAPPLATAESVPNLA